MFLQILTANFNSCENSENQIYFGAIFVGVTPAFLHPLTSSYSCRSSTFHLMCDRVWAGGMAVVKNSAVVAVVEGHHLYVQHAK